MSKAARCRRKQNLRKKSSLALALTLCLALVPLLVFSVPLTSAEPTQQPLWSYTTGGDVCSVAISSDGSYIAAGSGDDKVYLFSRTSSTPLWSYTTGGTVASVSISSDGSYIAAGSLDKKVYLFSRDSGTPLWSYDTGYWVRSVAISSDGNYIVAGCGHEGYAKAYKFSRTSSTPLWGKYIFGITGLAIPNKLTDISPDGTYAVVGSTEHLAWLFFDGNSWNYYTSSDEVRSVSLSSDGFYCAVGGGDKKVYLFSRAEPSSTPKWNYTTGGYVNSVAISSDGNYVAAGSSDYKVYLFSRALPNTAPTLSSGSVSPSSGAASSTFTYEVTYTDADGDAPSYIKVYIDGTGYSMTKISGTHTEGALYRYTTSTLSVGSHTYYFEASDGQATATSGSYPGPTVTEVQKMATALTISPSGFRLATENSTTFTATLTSGGSPLEGKTITWSKTAGTISPTSGTKLERAGERYLHHPELRDYRHGHRILRGRYPVPREPSERNRFG